MDTDTQYSVSAALGTRDNKRDTSGFFVLTTYWDVSIG